MSVIQRIQNLTNRGAVSDNHSAEQNGSSEIHQLKDKREALRGIVDKCHQTAVEVGDDLKKAEDQSFLSDIGDWFSGDDPEAEALEKDARNQASMERAQEQQEVIADQQKAELDKIAEANQRMQDAASQMTQMLRTVDQQRRTRNA